MVNFSYAAGILDRNNNWLWQGHVVARNAIHAKKILMKWKKKTIGNIGSIQVSSAFGKSKTKRKIGIY